MPEENDVEMAVGPFDDMEQCVLHFEEDPDVDDPQALCTWMDENQESTAVQEYAPNEDDVQALVEAMKDPSAESVLTNLQVTYVSGVENPAQDSQWVMAKDADAHDADWGVNAPLVTAKDLALDDGDESPDQAEQQKAWAAVLIPNETDKQGDVIPPESIEKAAHEFLSEFRNIDTDHDLLEGKGAPIESWTLKESREFSLHEDEGTREYPAGTWMLGVEFNDESWQRVKEGELTGFSIYGEAEATPIQDILGGSEAPDASIEADYAAEAAAKGADTTDNESSNMEDPEDTPEDGTENEAKDGEGEETPEGEQPEGESEEPTLKEIQDTVESTHETVTSVKDTQEDLESRLSEVEDEVFEKEDDEEPEGEATDEVDPDEVKEEAAEAASEAAEEKATEAATEAAEEAVKSLFGVDELPDDEDERQEVMRKAVHEESEGGDGIGSPDDWGADEVSEVMK